MPASAPRPTLRGRDAVAITVGLVLGAGIFRTPALVAGVAGDPALVLALWGAGALAAVVGALCYAELAAAYPDAGGDYHFLRRAYGDRLALLYAWARLAVVQTGSLALLAFVFGDYFARLTPLGPAVWAGVAVVAITAVNWVGVRQGARAQTWLTLLEVAGLVAVIVAGLLIAPAAPAGVAPPPPATGGIGLALVFVLLTYGGWSEAAYLSAEVRGGGRRILPVLLVSLSLLAALYMLANLAYLRPLGISGVARSDAVAADVARLAFGRWGEGAITLAIAIASLTSANATAITGARSAYALGRDVPALGWLGRWHGDSGSPRAALLAQGAVALALVIAGGFVRDGFQLAVEYTAPVFWFFLLLSGASLLVLRRRDPDTPRPFQVPLYPILPLAFCATNAWLLWSSLVHTGWGALAGVAVVVAGTPLLFLRRSAQ
jgi:basic amino acid/polyamine antiporter, APA family